VHPDLFLSLLEQTAQEIHLGVWTACAPFLRYIKGRAPGAFCVVLGVAPAVLGPWAPVDYAFLNYSVGPWRAGTLCAC
jgi:hypothetical protein